MLLTISYSESAYPITLVKPLKAIPYDYFGILVYFVYFSYTINKNLPITNSKLRNSDSVYLMYCKKFYWNCLHFDGHRR